MIHKKCQMNLVFKICSHFTHGLAKVERRPNTFIFRTPFSITPHSSCTGTLENAQNNLVSRRKPAFRAIIFDKDGTIICFNSLWVPWAKIVAHKISQDITKDIESEILMALGFCVETQRIFPGVLAEGTEKQISSVLVNLLVNHGICRNIAQSVVDKHIKISSISSQHVVQLYDLKNMFTTLRQHSIMTAICTSDSRKGTLHALVTLGISHLIDIIVCGDDHGRLPKPHPGNAKFICEQLNVKPEETVMVGDTPTDVAFAKSAKLGLCIGVLSGIGQQSDLEATWYNYSDQGDENDSDQTISYQQRSRLHILPSVAHIIPLVLPSSNQSINQLLCNRKSDNGKLYSKISSQKFKLVITDKDGSFVNVHSRWAEWCEKLNARLADKCSPQIASKFLKAMGYCSETRKISKGILSEGSMLFIKECLRCLLILEGYGIDKSDSIVQEVWICPSTVTSVVMPDIVETVKRLRNLGFCIAVNSSDNRAACDSFLSDANLRDYINITLSAEDAGYHPKPLPHTVHQIMEKTGCKPEETIVIGDTPADLLSGRSAKVGLTIGLLSGFSLGTDLINYSNLLLPNLAYLPDLFTDNKWLEQKSI